MRAIVKIQPVRGAELIDLPIPEPAENEVLIQVERSAICGGDIHPYIWNSNASNFYSLDKFPLMMGHEIAGRIIAVGDNVNKSRTGQRVAYETHPYCGECYMCRSGNRHLCVNKAGMERYGYSAACAGFAEYKLARESMLYVLPDTISFEQGALLEPGGVAMHAYEDSHMVPGDVVVVYGCGPIGLIAMQIFKACGAGTVIGIDINEFRINMAKKYADVVINSNTDPLLDIIKEISKFHNGVDIVIETTAAASVYETMFEMVRPEAHIILVGHPCGEVPINITKYIGLKEVDLKGLSGRKIWETWDKLSALESSKRINLLDIVTHRYKLEQYKKAFETSMKNAGKVLLIHK